MERTFAEQLILYQSNVLPFLLEKLSQQLHVSTQALTALEIGYVLRNNCWAFPERDEYGDIVGISLRQWNGKKYMLTGSKRGLIYVPNVHRSSTVPERYCTGPHNWTRTSEDLPCPICGKPDWCLLSAEEPENPKAVLCCRIQSGSSRDLGTAGYLHILKEEGELSRSGSVLAPSEHPVLIVEGASDVAAALDIDLIAVGRPSSSGCLDKLLQLVSGRNIVILGENDSGAGKEGMEKAFEVLRSCTKQAVKLLPPEGIKDLRQWVTQGLTQQQFLTLIRTSGDDSSDNIVLPSVAPLDLAKQWLDATYRRENIITLRVFHDSWYAYTGQCYQEISKAKLRQQLYQFFGNKQYKKDHGSKGFDIIKYDPTKHKLDEIVDALLAFCPITADEIPCWLGSSENMGNPKHILAFSNGYINIDDFTGSGENARLRKSTPRFFSLASYPYDFTSKATCDLWESFLADVFADDPAKITLLQEWFGYNLIPDNSQERFMMLLGPTRAGKGTILDVLTYLLGDDQVLATSFEDYTRRFAIYPFFGKLAAVIGDVSVGDNYSAVGALNLLKRITGNDVITIERKGKDITQTCVKLYARFTMAANVMPRLPDYARTIESRMLILKFLKSYMGREDITLKARLKLEAPGILLWALKGLQRLRSNKLFTLPVTHSQTLQRIRGDITPITEFIGDCCDLGEGDDYFIICDHLYDCWKQWAIKNGERPQTARWLSSSLQTLFPGCTRTRRLMSGRRKWIFRGLRLQPRTAKEMGVE